MKIYHSFETERLHLRATSAEDAPFILQLLNTPKWIQNIGGRNVHTIEEAKIYIEKKMKPQLDRLGYSNYTVIRKSDGAKMGTCGLYDREGLDGIDIGFAFLPEYEKQGFAFEASNRLKTFALEDICMKTIQGITTKENIASQKLLEKLGFAMTGTTVIPNDEEELLLYQYSV